MTNQFSRHASSRLQRRLIELTSVLLTMGLLTVFMAVDEAAALKVRVGYLPVPDSIAYFAAKDRGFFKEHGVEIEASVVIGSAVAIPAMEGGSIDVAWVDTMALSNAHLKGFDMQFVTPGGPITLKPNHVGHAYLARANDASISSMRDLKGKKVAIIARGGISELALRVLLDQAGVSFNSVTILELAFPKMMPALMQGSIDVAAQVEPFVTLMQMKKTGKAIRRGMFGGLLGPRWMVVTWVGKKSWIDKHRAAAQGFVQGLIAGVNYIHAHPEEIPALTAANTRMKAALVKRIVQSAFEPAIRLGDVQPVIDAAAKYGLIPRSFPAREIISDITPVRP